MDANEINEILGVSDSAGEEEIRTAYLNKVKEFPPDRAPEQFEKIRDAYETLRNPRNRARLMFEGRESRSNSAPLVSLLEGRRTNRVFAGPQPWRDVLRNK